MFSFRWMCFHHLSSIHIWFRSLSGITVQCLLASIFSSFLSFFSVFRFFFFIKFSVFASVDCSSAGFLSQVRCLIVVVVLVQSHHLMIIWWYARWLLYLFLHSRIRMFAYNNCSTMCIVRVAVWPGLAWHATISLNRCNSYSHIQCEQCIKATGKSQVYTLYFKIYTILQTINWILNTYIFILLHMFCRTDQHNNGCTDSEGKWKH